MNTVAAYESLPHGHVLVILFSVLGWRYLSDAANNYHKKKSESLGEPYSPRWAIYALSFVHAVLSSMEGAYAMIMAPAQDQMCSASDPWRDRMILVSCGYFLNDLFIELKKEKKNAGMLFHHIFVFTFLFLATQTRMFTHPLAVLLLNEASTPFLSIRWNLKRIEGFRALTPGEKKMDYFNGLSLIAMFGIFRIALIPIIWLQVFQAGCLDTARGNGDLLTGMMIFFGNVNFPVLWAMNLYWYNIMVNQAIAVLQGKSAGKGNAKSSEESDKMD